MTSRTVSSSAATSRAIAATGVPDADARIMVARRTRIELPRPRRAIRVQVELKQAWVACALAQAIPLHTDGMRIGLLGGSFNPPHVAHRAISLFAIKRLKLDRVWWLVTPGNPLKENGALARSRPSAPTAARKIADDPRIDVSCLESVIGTRYTVDTISLSAPPRFPACALSGSWAPTISRNSIAGRTGSASPSEVPIAVIDRPPQSFRALAAPAAQALARYRLPENRGRQARRPARRRPGCFSPA